MWRTILLLTFPAAGPAQPVTQPSPCEVTISRAPDEVREAIEAWVNAEPRCTTTLDVRVVPTDGGFYLFARDGAGRVRERVVPDAQAAGVLVASWVADDLIAGPPSVNVDIDISASFGEEQAMPPSATAPVVTATAEPQRRSGRSFSLGGIWKVHDGGGGGLRGELDVVRRGRWSLGAVLAGSVGTLEVHWIGSYVTTIDIRLLATLAHTVPLGKNWDLRLAAGAGVLSTSAIGEFDGEDIDSHGVFPTAEASVLLTRAIGNRWAFALGPIATWYQQTYKIDDPWGDAMLTMSERDVEVMAFTGFRLKL